MNNEDWVIVFSEVKYKSNVQLKLFIFLIIK